MLNVMARGFLFLFTLPLFCCPDLTVLPRSVPVLMMMMVGRRRRAGQASSVTVSTVAQHSAVSVGV